ncbi:hypothetical protein [Synechococcus sp. PCC 7336]|uniref:hypothetical protein n=1 Tax=Synechococcus sp. PCC 7336 TaxID=195250 RepID=UPI00034C75BB|nr:hypothetical protein [Synechococcus sp. PCC 7336]
MIANFNYARFTAAIGVLTVLAATPVSARPAILQRLGQLEARGTSRNRIERAYYAQPRTEGIAVASTDVSSAIATETNERESDILTVLSELSERRTSRNSID